MSTLQYPSSTFDDFGDAFWNVPRLHKDKFYRKKERPVTSLRPLIPRREGLPPGPPSAPLTGLRSKSSSAIPTVKSLRLRASPTASVDMTSSRFSLDTSSLSGAVPYQPGGLTQGIRAKGSRLLRRQNSIFNSRNLEWQDGHEGGVSAQVPTSHSRRSSGQAKTKSGGHGAVIDKQDISEPFDFQHLTHTHARHFQEIDQVDHHDLINEFSAIRASQMPRRELKGIKAERLPSKNSQSEPTSPTRQTPTTPTYITRSTSSYFENTRPRLGQYESQGNYAGNSKPASHHRKLSMRLTAPPPRSSSRTAVTNAPDFFTKHHEGSDPHHDDPSVPQHVSLRDGPEVLYQTPLSSCDGYDSFQDFDFSMPHAVTTPDDTAFPLSPASFRAPGAELPNVPEEDERANAGYSRPSTPGSGLRHAKSFPVASPNSHRWSRSPRNAPSEESEPVALRAQDMTQSEIMLPLVGESYDDIPVRPRCSRRISFKPEAFEMSWEDDIDYCYEHAAEADCDFDWDRVSARDDSEYLAAERNALSGTPSISEYENILSAASTNTSTSLPRLRTSLVPPPLSCANSAVSPSVTSLITPATPSYPSQTSQPYGLYNRADLGSADVLPLTPPIPGLMGNRVSKTSEEAYDNLFLSKPLPDEQLPLHSMRFEPPTSLDTSPRSSRSPISKCNSQESFMLSRSSSLKYPRSCDSFSSVPELIPSQRSRETFALSSEQLADFAATIKAAETSSDVTAPRAPRPNPATARKPNLQKASSFNSVEEETHEDSEIVVLPSPTHHERSQSAAVGQPLSTYAQQRKRSASSATALKASRGSYSLFPPTSTRAAV